MARPLTNLCARTQAQAAMELAGAEESATDAQVRTLAYCMAHAWHAWHKTCAHGVEG